MLYKAPLRRIIIILILTIYLIIDLVVGLKGDTSGIGKIYLGLALLVLTGNIFLLNFKLNIIDLFFFLWFIWAYLGSKFWNIETFFIGLSGPIFFTLLGLNIYFFIGRISILSEKLLAFRTFVFGGVLLTFLTIILRQKLGLVGARFNPEHVNANKIAYFAILSIFCLIILWNGNKNNKYNILYLALFLFINSVILFTASRKAFLGEFFFISSFFIYKYKSRILKNPGYVIAGIVIIFSIYFVFKDSFMESTLGMRLTEAYEQEKIAENPEERMTGRGHHYVQGFIAFKEHPIIGVGLGSINVYFGTRLKSHSEYVSMFGETGAVGFILYFTAIFLLFKKLIRGKNRSPNEEKSDYVVIILSLITILLIAFGRWNYDVAPYWIFMGLARSYLN